MELARARGELIGRDALRETVLGGEIRRQDLDFAHHLERRIDVRLKTLSFRLVGNDAVEHDFILEVHAAIDSMAEFAPLNTRSDKKVVINLPVARTNVPGTTTNQHGYLFDQFVFNESAELRLGGLQGDLVCQNLNCIGYNAGRKGSVRGRGSAYVDVDVPEHPRGKAGHFDPHYVRSRDQVCKRVGTHRTSFSLGGDTRGGVGRRHFSPRNGSTRGIRD